MLVALTVSVPATVVECAAHARVRAAMAVAANVATNASVLRDAALLPSVLNAVSHFLCRSSHMSALQVMYCFCHFLPE